MQEDLSLIDVIKTRLNTTQETHLDDYLANGYCIVGISRYWYVYMYNDITNTSVCLTYTGVIEKDGFHNE